MIGAILQPTLSQREIVRNVFELVKSSGDSVSPSNKTVPTKYRLYTLYTPHRGVYSATESAGNEEGFETPLYSNSPRLAGGFLSGNA